MNTNPTSTSQNNDPSRRSLNLNRYAILLVVVLVGLIVFEWKKTSESRKTSAHADPRAEAFVAPESAPDLTQHESAKVGSQKSKQESKQESKYEQTLVSREVTLPAERSAQPDQLASPTVATTKKMDPRGFAAGRSAEVTERLPQPSQSKPRPLSTSLPYATSTKSQSQARAMLDSAAHEYQVGASLSAETSAWNALASAAEAIEITANSQPPKLGASVFEPTTELQIARTAIFEARDFADQTNAKNKISLDMIVKSHQTKSLHASDLRTTTATQAIEIYLDDARVRLANLAAQNRMAAEAMDLLAAIYLTRNDPKTMPTSTSLCLRRAALEGQPSNASLASRLGFQLAKIGLFDESQRVLSHSLNIRYDLDTQMALAFVMRSSGHPRQAADLERAYQAASEQAIANANRKPIPQVEQLSPAEFAAVSRPVMPVARSLPIQPGGNQMGGPTPGKFVSNPQSGSNQVPAGFASLKMNQTSDVDSEEKPGVVRKTIASMTKWW